MKFISTARCEGATILYGGARPQVCILRLQVTLVLGSSVFDPNQAKLVYWQHLKRGFFIEPTIITNVSTSMQIWREEVFGPVICVKEFRTEREAVELANDTQWVTLCGTVEKKIKPVLVFLICFFSQLWSSWRCDFQWSREVRAHFKGNFGLNYDVPINFTLD